MKVRGAALNTEYQRTLEIIPHPPPLPCEGRGDPDGQTDNQARLPPASLEVKHLEERRVRSDMKDTV
jgi:hypothetical protein